jgi:multiple sugar transport system permease protein
MKITYYARKRIQDMVINVIMIAFLGLTLLPIGWMIYSSLKDSTDIAIGKVGLRRAGTEVLEIKPEGENLLALSADGSINLYRASDLKRLKHKSFKTSATSYLVDDKYIWISSAKRGLIRVDRDNYSKSKRFKYPLYGFDMNKVPNSFIRQQGNNIFITLDYKGFNGVLKFDKANLKFMKLLKNAKRRYFPNAGDIVVKNYKGIDSEIFSELRKNGVLYLGSRGGDIYKYDPIARKVIDRAKLPKGHLLVRWYNYIDMWKNVNFGLYLKNSLIICGFTMIFAMIFATFAAYALSRFRFPGSDLFSNAILATQMIPMIMYLIPIYIMFVRFTIMTNIPVKGTYPGLILIYSAWFLPFSIWILRGFFASIPRELEEAARIDGCSRFQVFWHVALPLARPGIIATGIYIFLQAWDELMFAWVLTNGDTMTIPVGIRLFVGNYQNRFDLMMAAATVATIPVVVLFFMLQRHIVRGLTAGAVKG